MSKIVVNFENNNNKRIEILADLSPCCIFPNGAVIPVTGQMTQLKLSI